MSQDYHTPVLLKQVIDLLALQPGDSAVDCTLGDAGHTIEILKATAPSGKVLAIEGDTLAIERASSRLKEANLLDRVVICQGNFRDLKEIVEQNSFENISGILLDLGVSSFQLNEKSEGFSFRDLGPMIMKFNGADGGDTAYEILNKYQKQKLKHIFQTYGEIKHAGAIAHKIIEARSREPIIETPILVRALFPRLKNKAGNALNPYQSKLLAKVWQALRIEVNDELNALQDVLPQAISLLSARGRLVVISYHSLEDRIVKRFFKSESRELDSNERKSIIKIITKKPLVPDFCEREANPRSRSAKLRAAEKI